MMDIHCLKSFVFFAMFLDNANSVQHSKFRKCSDTGFCKRNRGDQFQSQNYVVQHKSVKFSTNSVITADLQNTLYPLSEPLNLKVIVLKEGIIHIAVREKNSKHIRYEVQDVLLDVPHQSGVDCNPESNILRCHINKENGFFITYAPFGVTMLMRGKEVITVNNRQKMNFEIYRSKNPKPEETKPEETKPEETKPEETKPEETKPEETKPDESETTNEIKTEPSTVEESSQADSKNNAPPPPSLKYPYDIDDMWSESWSGQTDQKPRGPSAVALDTSFIGSSFVYGIPEHASSFALKNTDNQGYNEPYRLFNLDVFEYELDQPMSLYGSVPLIISHTPAFTSGVFWLNAAETFVDIHESSNSKDIHWISESGILDVFLIPGPEPYDVFRQYTSLTGTPYLPPLFSIGYHQCRWNYKDEADVRDVDAGFDNHDLSYDVIWLDIEHTDGKKYFTWDPLSFPTPKEMINNIASKGRKMVTIIDPHIKRTGDYHIHKHAEEAGYYVKKHSGEDYEGHCWPGSVSYLDFLLPHVREWWADQFLLENYKGSTPDLYTWNDMNEPSVFNGPEVTMPKDCLHANGDFEHRDVHNQYGFYFQMATAQGLKQRNNARPFVLSRSFFAGSQMYGAIWTGDNLAEWSHLKASIPMLLSMNIAGIVFSGADVGGFFGNPSAELLVRWYQAAAFQPFFRGHAHIDTNRREPWLFGETNTNWIRMAIRRRYAYLPYIYTLFAHASVSGIPIMRPMWVEFPEETNAFGIEDQFLLGNCLLIHPVTDAGQTSVSVYLPGGSSVSWYQIETSQIQRLAGGQRVDILTSMDTIPVFQIGGSIVPKRERPRRSSKAMEKDPFTLVVAIDPTCSCAIGDLYLDDGNSFNYKNGEFIHRKFEFTKNTLVSTMMSFKDSKYTNACTVERVVILGLTTSFSRAKVVASDGSSHMADVIQTFNPDKLIIRKPDARIDYSWNIVLS